MKLNDRTLTALTALCLAVGVAVAGFVIQSDEGTNTPALEVASMAATSFERQSVSMSFDAVAAQSQLSSPKVFASLTPAPKFDKTQTTLNNILIDAPFLAASMLPANLQLSVPQPQPSPVLASLGPELAHTTASDALPLLQAKFPTDLCRINLRATTKPTARVKLQIMAPCHPETIVTIEHAGLRFRERLDKDGTLAVIIPAFVQFSKFDITLRDGLRATTGAYIVGLSSLNRTGFSAAGAINAILRAHDSSTPGGIISRAQPRTYKHALLSGGGYLTILGDSTLPNPQIAQIYTHPNNDNQKLVRLEILANRNKSNCAGGIDLQTARHSPILGPSKRHIRVNLTDCDTENGSLVLKNLLKDMRMAQN